MGKLAEIIIEDAEKSTRGVNFSWLSDKTILITGASGLVGTYFLASLKNISVKSRIKFKVIAVCQNKPEKYWEEIAKSLQSGILKGDLCNDKFAEKLPKADIIIHSAGYGQPGKFMVNPFKTIKLNTSVTLKLFEKLKPGGKFLFLSSSEVYNGLDKPPFKESQIGVTNTDNPRSCYIEAKRCGEAIANAAHNKGIDAKSARLSLAYGPGTKKDDKRVINSFIGQALNENKINMMDSGTAVRTYCYITDAIQIMWNILLNGEYNIYNVGGVSKTTIMSLAKLIGQTLKVPVTFPKIKKQALRGAPVDVSLNLNKIMKEFNKKNFITLEDGVLKTIAWQRELYNL